MPDLFDMLSTLTRRRKVADESPFDSIMATQNWLKALPGESDYDTHHVLVEGLERFNADNVDANPERLRMLMAIEETGLPLQFRIVEQYVRVSNQASFSLAKQTLWRESWAF